MAIFSKILSQTDVEARLSIPTESFKKYLLPRFERTSHKKDLLVKDWNGVLWSFGCAVRLKGYYSKPSEGYYFKPVLSKSWRQFARAKALKAGNKVTLYIENDPISGAEYRIEVKKVTRLFGMDIEEPV